ncbi:hypothetical protein RSAG8_05176, partial [Rhizoctonia solani AG-8 WAC10335]
MWKYGHKHNANKHSGSRPTRAPGSGALPHSPTPGTYTTFMVFTPSPMCSPNHTGRWSLSVICGRGSPAFH